MQYFITLKILDLNYNQITDVSQVSYLNELTRLRLVKNRKSDLSSWDHPRLFPHMAILNLGNNEIEDISALEKLVPDNLTWLYLGFNQIKEIKAVGHLTGLKSLSLRDNYKIDDIKDITQVYHFVLLKKTSISTQVDDNKNKISYNYLNKLGLRRPTFLMKVHLHYTTIGPQQNVEEAAHYSTSSSSNSIGQR